jgi:hypothetical protein
MFNKHMKRCSISLAVKELQIKTTLIFHLILVRMPIIEKKTNASEDSGQGGEPAHTHTVGGNVN